MSTYIERGAVKVIELIGVSDRSFEDAVTTGSGQGGGKHQRHHRSRGDEHEREGGRGRHLAISHCRKGGLRRPVTASGIGVTTPASVIVIACSLQRAVCRSPRDSYRPRRRLLSEFGRRIAIPDLDVGARPDHRAHRGRPVMGSVADGRILDRAAGAPVHIDPLGVLTFNKAVWPVRRTHFCRRPRDGSGRRVQHRDRCHRLRGNDLALRSDQWQLLSRTGQLRV